MKFLFKILFLIMTLSFNVHAEINIVSSSDKIRHNKIQNHKFSSHNIQASAPVYSLPYMSKKRSAIFRTILNPVYSRSEKKISNMSPMTH